MLNIAEFFDSIHGFSLWKGIIVTVISYLVVWLIAIILSRWNWIANKDNQLKVYFAWIYPFCIHILLCGLILIDTAMYFKKIGMPVGFALGWVPILIIDIICINTLNNKVKTRIKKLEKRI